MIRRVATPGIEPLEVWDLEVGGQTLWESQESTAWPRALVAAVRALRAGAAVARGGRRLRQLDVASLRLCGGGAGEAEADALRGLGLPVSRDPAGRFAGEAGGWALGGGAVLDLGQTALKLSAGGRRWLLPRDRGKLPVRTGKETPACRAAQRRALRGFLAAARARLGETRGRLVVALPCALDAAGVPGECSYIGLDSRLLEDVFRGMDILLLNDAELAALSALVAGQDTAGGCLLLSIGFGVGAALLCAGAALPEGLA